MSSQLSAHAITAHTAMTRISVSRCSTLPAHRGSASAEKCSTNFSTDISTLPSLIKGEPAQPQGRRMKSASQKSEHVIIVPGGLLATRPHADPGCSVPPHEVDGDLAQDGQVASCRAIPDAAVILAEGDIEDPMEPIFNRPVPADRLDQHRGVITAA